MRILLDGRSVLELFSGSARGRKVRTLIEGSEEVLLSAITLFEVGAAIEEAFGPKRADVYIRAMRSHWRTVDVDAGIAAGAVEFRKRTRAPMTDCVLLSVSERTGARIVAGCSHLKKLSMEHDIIIV